MKSCIQATYLMSKKLDTQLTLLEKMSLRMHLFMCGNCNLCNDQLTTIHDLCSQRITDIHLKGRDKE
jgi:hypothetical protein